MSEKTQANDSGAATTPASKGSDSLNFNRAALLDNSVKRLMTSYGLAEPNAARFAEACFETLSDMYGGMRIYIGKRQIDRNQIRADYRAGMPIERLARTHGLTTRSIRRIVIRRGQK